MQLKGLNIAVACFVEKKKQKETFLQSVCWRRSGYVTPVYKEQHHHHS